MKRDILVIIDCSGSMREMGKDVVLKLARNSIMLTVKEWTDISLKFFKWNEKVEALKNLKELFSKGSADIHVLRDFFSEIDDNSRVLVISDGLWADGAADKLKKTISERNIYTMPISVGIDFNQSNLKKISYPSAKVWQIIDLPTALHCLSYGG